MLYDLALTFQERSQRAEARLLEDFQDASENLAGVLGDSMILEDEDERLWFRASGAFEAEVVPEVDGGGEGSWQPFTSPEELVQFYDPTDLFGDLAEALAEQYPDVAPEFDDDVRPTSRKPTSPRATEQEATSPPARRRALTRPTGAVPARPGPDAAGGAGLLWRRSAPIRPGGEVATLIASREVLPGQRLLTWQVPGLARRIQAGQLVHLLAPRPGGSLLPASRRAGFDRVGGTVALLANERSPGAELLRLREGDQARLDGPLGRGFRVDARSRHLLLVCDGTGIGASPGAPRRGRQRRSAGDAAAGRRVRRPRCSPRGSCRTRPSTCVATADGSLGHRGDVDRPGPRYEAWADQCFAAGARRSWSGSPSWLAVATRAWAWHALVVGRVVGATVAGRSPARPGCRWRCPHEVGCALGVCLGCVVDGVDGPLRVCREGPAFSAGELALGVDPR